MSRLTDGAGWPRTDLGLRRRVGGWWPARLWRGRSSWSSGGVFRSQPDEAADIIVGEIGHTDFYPAAGHADGPHDEVCEPALGSGAFLVEACRQLAARLVTAWARHPGTRPAIPADEDEYLLARRLVVQRCLYGVDRNPLAVDLARLSLWLATLARDLEFKARKQLGVWASGRPEEYWPRLRAYAADLNNGRHPIRPFHWELEFPEVFHRDNPGFDAIVGNPPFAGKNTLINGNRDGYLAWLQTLHEGAHGNADLVAHFFRRAFGLLRADGCQGLIATNTIGQGDTRATGLQTILASGGSIAVATRRLPWPGEAAVVVSVVHVQKGICSALGAARPHR